jgi:hypothetical protein
VLLHYCQEALSVTSCVGRPVYILSTFCGHSILRRHLHIMGLSDSPLCRKCGAEEETSADVLCECEALATHRHIYLGSFFLNPEGIKELSLGAIWTFITRTGHL